MVSRWLAPLGLVAIVIVLAACGSSSPGGAGSGGYASSPQAASSSGGTALKTTTIGGATVLTDARGLTLYWFVPDTSTTSKCSGTCATYWPPVKGPAQAGPGVTGKLGTITRPDGAVQATYDGHPLYTYVGDSQPGQAKGNGLNLNGGVWHEVTVSGAAPSPSQGSSGGGGYGW